MDSDGAWHKSRQTPLLKESRTKGTLSISKDLNFPPQFFFYSVKYMNV